MSDVELNAEVVENNEPVERRDILREALTAVETDAAPKTPVMEAATEEKPSRERDGAGKFVAKTKEQAEPELPLEAAPVANPWDKAPNSWKKEKRALWESMSPEQRQYAFQREEEMRNGIEPLKPKAQFADQINKVLEPYMGTIRGLGVEPHQAVEALIRTDHHLRNGTPEQKRAMFYQLATQYGVNLSPVDGEQPQPAFDPNASALRNEITQIRGTLASFQENQAKAEEYRLQNEINTFSAGKEHFDDVRDDMAKLLQGGLATNLQDAYDMAIRLNPEISEAIAQATQAKADAEKKAQQDAAAKKARAAAVSPKSSTPRTAAPNAAQTRRERLNEAFGSLDTRL